MGLTEQDSGFLVSLVINGSVAVACFVLFPFLKYKFKNVYEPLCSKRINAPAKPTDGFLNWIFSTYYFKEEDIYTKSGLDALMYIRFLKMILRIVCFQCIYSFAVLIPVNVTGSNKSLPPSNELYTQGLAVQSMSNIPEKSNRFWAHLIDVFYISIITLIFLFYEIRVYVNYRIRQKKEKGQIENYSVVITEIPKAMRKENGLLYWFEINFPTWKILDLQKTFNLPKMEKLLEDREKLAREYENAQHYMNINNERKEIRDGPCCCGKKVDAIDFYRESVYKKERKFEKKKRRIVEEKDGNPINFVTFDSIQNQAICSQSILDQNLDILLPRHCHEPRAILWKNTNITRKSFITRSLIVFVITFFTIFFYMIPISFIMVLTNLNYLRTVSWLSWIGTFLDAIGPVVSGFIVGYLPVIILAVLVSVILPLFVRKMTEMQGHFSKVSIEISFFEKMFLFHLFNTFLGVIIAGSIFNFIERAIQDPSLVISLLASSVPLQAFFFTNYVMLYALFTIPFFSLIRIVDFIVYHIKTRFAKKSLREQHEAKTFGPFSYANVYGRDILVFLVVLTYSTMYPFIMIFGFLYFAISYIVNKYNLCYVISEEFRMGGLFFPKTISKVLYCLLFYQAVMFCVLLGFKFFFCPLILPIFVVTFMFRFIMRSYINKAEKFITFDQFHNKRVYVQDQKENRKDLKQENTPQQEEINFEDDSNIVLNDSYVQPCLRDLDDVFKIGEYGEFEYQTENIRKDIRDSSVHLSK